ncbi:uncharacterized protein BT62DRAFT_995171 [Guyanagaster necrorhizus]|uniref:F-box domain-containing protein n=1 Tax=Guyanagaster necrorhizus TaxID=856835 RepID=A0A9P8AR97_9AGAR|nr:uncharacterized protein BT62DRAFT_995171 [Guyanagaster necrorhizus MCA 3950]KAG7444651.1 hypothetical protein BT62DRAFT_995171 [Guyanagaster necrorhizus MCA 3950]
MSNGTMRSRNAVRLTRDSRTPAASGQQEHTTPGQIRFFLPDRQCFMLLQLPAELLLQISALLSHDTQKNLRLVCKPLHDVTTEFVFATFRINFSNDAKMLDWNMLNELAMRSTDMWRYVKVLRLTHPSPLVFPFADHNAWRNSTKDIIRGLSKAIVSLENVTTVYWTSVKDIDNTIVEALILSISRLPSLQKFTIYMTSRMLTPVPRFQLKNLTFMDISLCRPPWDDFIRDSLPSILENSPNLSFLSLADGTNGPMGSLGSLFQNLHRPLRLESLVIHNLSVPPLSILHPHFQSLTSLVLSSTGNLPPGFWFGIQANNVHLRSLNIDDVDAALLDYLLSYTDVEAIRLKVPGDNAVYDELGIKFYSQVLPHHSATLDSLSILPTFEGTWSLQDSTMLPVLQCRRLVSLSMSVRLSDISDLTEPSIVSDLLHSIKSLHNLSSLYLAPSFSLHAPLSFPEKRWKASIMLGQVIEAVNTIPNQDPYLALEIFVQPFGGSYRAYWDTESGFSSFLCSHSCPQ